MFSEKEEILRKLGDKEFYAHVDLVEEGFFPTTQTVLQMAKKKRISLKRISFRRFMIAKNDLFKLLEKNTKKEDRIKKIIIKPCGETQANLHSGITNKKMLDGLYLFCLDKSQKFLTKRAVISEILKLAEKHREELTF